MNRKLRVLDLFSGIGGFSLGLEQTDGFETVAFCEIEPYCRAVLAKHWPGVPCYDDVRELTASRLAADGIAVDVICGGFPCQDVSFAGKRAGLEGARSGLWGEYGRIIGEVRPHFVIVENVTGLLSLGMATVLGDLSALGYDAVWDCVPASAVGAHHRRDRVWLVAHAGSAELRQQPRRRGWPGRAGAAQSGKHGSEPAMADANFDVRLACRPSDTGKGAKGWNAGRSVERQDLVADARREPGQVSAQGRKPAVQIIARDDWWATEPDVGRVADGVSSRVDRLKSLGNAVVPQIPKLIGYAILEAQKMTPTSAGGRETP